MSRVFNTQKDIEHIIHWVRNYFIKNGDVNTKAVIGISGGKDSTVSAALLVKALGKDRVIGVLMPDGEQLDIVDAREVCAFLDIQSIEVNIGEVCDCLYEAIDYKKCVETPRVMTNTPARIRMAVLYAIAALHHGRVCSNSNASEIYVGYSTKFGDNAGDFALLRDYTKSEVVAMGKALELPEYLVNKAPADGMTGKTDEEQLGYSYQTIDKMLLDGECPDDFVIYQSIVADHELSLHKDLNIPHPSRTDGCLYNPIRYEYEGSHWF